MNKLPTNQLQELVRQDTQGLNSLINVRSSSILSLQSVSEVGARAKTIDFLLNFYRRHVALQCVIKELPLL
jgi:hypothetical protein